MSQLIKHMQTFISMNAVILYALINYIYFFLNGETVEMHVYLIFLGGTLFIDNN